VLRDTDAAQIHSLRVERVSVRRRRTLGIHCGVRCELRNIAHVPATQRRAFGVDELDAGAGFKTARDDPARARYACEILRMTGTADEAQSLSFVTRCRRGIERKQSHTHPEPEVVRAADGIEYRRVGARLRAR